MTKFLTWILALLAWFVSFPAYGDSHTWLGTSSGDFNTAGNWSGAAVPITGDSVYFTYGSVSCIAYDASAKHFATVVVSAGYTGTLGTSVASPLKFGADKLYIAGGGANLYLNTGATTDWEQVYVESAVSNQTIHFAGTTTHYVGSNGFYVARGTVELDDGTIPVCTMLKHGFTPALTITDGGVVTTLYQLAGTTTINDGGTLTTGYMDAGTLSMADGTLTTLIQRGGTTTWSTATTMTSATVYGGILDCSKDARPKTITTLKAYTGATVNLNNGVGSITVTNDDSVGSPTTYHPLLP